MVRPSPAPVALADPADARPSPNSRLVAIRANLMPDEIVVARRTDQLRRHVIIALSALLAFLLFWYGLSWWQTNSAEDDLTSAQQQTVALQDQQHRFAPLTEAQRVSSTVAVQLHKLMTGDLSWKDMLATLRSQAGADVTLLNVTGTIISGAGASVATNTSSGIAVLNTSGKPVVGSLTITGRASDKDAVAAYVDRLATVKGLATPYPANVTVILNGVSFTVQAVLTTDVLGGRYAAAPAATGATGTTGTTAGGK
ncbi:MAG: hypothetical protein ACTHMS_04330 [Jatrophihabitans sp.]|uniref:hypothetical protein n=1 Tax=Jatrophihabitans sp. TaxID=1932789 RepID=UPI003F7DDB96